MKHRTRVIIAYIDISCNFTLAWAFNSRSTLWCQLMPKVAVLCYAILGTKFCRLYSPLPFSRRGQVSQLETCSFLFDPYIRVTVNLSSILSYPIVYDCSNSKLGQWCSPNCGSPLGICCCMVSMGCDIFNLNTIFYWHLCLTKELWVIRNWKGLAVSAQCHAHGRLYKCSSEWERGNHATSHNGCSK